jgi:hypothetical protein
MSSDDEVDATDRPTTSKAAMKNRARRKRARERVAPPRASEEKRARETSTTHAGGSENDEDVMDASDLAVVRREGAYGSYGSMSGGMSIEDDEWATATRTWRSLFTVLGANGFRTKKVWAPFVYDELAGKRMREAGFERVVHKRWDFFDKVRDGPFVRSLDAVVDNPPYTGKGMKQKVLKSLVDAELPFCLLLPLGVVHGAFVREMLEERYVQIIVPRKCYVFKKNGAEIPFKFLVWLCYKMELERDLYLID